MKIAVGADHAGYELKDQIKQHLQQQGIEIRDEGTSSPESVDYPDYARAVAHDVSQHRADLAFWCAAAALGWPLQATRSIESGPRTEALNMKRRLTANITMATFLRLAPATS